MPIQPGTKLGAYVVGQLIGQGAMGSVYSARHEALDRFAAVKVMHSLSDDPAAAARFQREGQAIAHLRHPNILTVYDYGEFEGTPYLIVEHVAGGSLAARLKDKSRMEVPVAIGLLRGMAAGLDHAHKLGVVHRDVKPANVLMGPSEATGQVPVIADFGLAKLQTQATMTASGVATGTPAYMSPEQISDGTEIGPAADIYALATVAYEMLTGHRPYESDNVMQLLMAKLRDEPTPPTAHNPSLPRRVDSVLLRGLARKPEARWSSCSAMVEALAGVLEPKPDLFAATEPLTRQRRRDRKRWAWLAIPVAALVGALVLLVVLPRFKHVPAVSPSPSPPPVSSVVPCPLVSPNPPQLSATPNPAEAGAAVTYSATGFDANSPLFIVMDAVGDCSRPTQGTVVFTTGSLNDPFTSDPIPLAADLKPGEYQLRACSHNVGSNPTSCVQVLFTVTAAPNPSPAASPAASPTESPAASPTA
ncbi:MAG TPA: serine/threonine-protein kinase [Candidatus Dormibacteraeota bacterium]|nr:serine/threonine-protein kinase [Candidatus Dormibacteraeota bacterium]